MKRVEILLIFILAAMIGCSKADVESTELNLDKLFRPIGFKTTFVGADYVLLAWQGNSPSFLIEYSMDKTFESDVTTIDQIERTTQTVKGLIEGKVYYFRIKGVSSNGVVGSSEFTEPIEITTQKSAAIPNIAAEAKMEWVLTPWKVTHTITVTWGAEEIEPEEITQITLTTTDVDGSHTLSYDVSEREAKQQKKIITKELVGDTRYIVNLFAGTRDRGEVAVTTAKDPAPSITALADLDFGTTPVSAMVSVNWQLYYVASSSLASVEFYKGNELTPTKSVAITSTDIANEGISDIKGLDPETNYTVKLMNHQAEVIAFVQFTTPDKVSQNIIVVRPEDDLKVIIEGARSNDTVYLTPGVHTIIETVAVTSNLVLTSGSLSRTTLNMAKQFMTNGDLPNVAFENIRFMCSTYFNQPSADFNIGSYKISNCIVSLNHTATGNSSLFASATAAVVRNVDKYIIENSTIYQNIGNACSGIYYQGSGSGNVVGQFSFKNITYVGGGRGMISIPNADVSKGDVPLRMNIENCTFYSVSNGNTHAIIDVRYAGANYAANSYINIKNTLVNFGKGSGSKPFMWFTFNGSGNNQYVPLNQITCDNAYYFASQPPSYGGSSYNITSKLKSYDGSQESLWVNPMLDPTDPGASFRIKPTSGISATVGDPRWNN